MKSKYGVLAGVLAAGMVCTFGIPTFAQKPFMDKIRKMYEFQPNYPKCEVCHEKRANEEPGRKNLNSFGKAIQADPDMKPLLGKDESYKFTEADIKILEKVLLKLENLDSDGDTVTNKEELILGTNPGDPKSVPDKKALAKYRKEHPAGK